RRERLDAATAGHARGAGRRREARDRGRCPVPGRHRRRGRRCRGPARPGARRMSGVAVEPARAPDERMLRQVMAGCTVLVTADRRKEELGAALGRRGAQVRYAPALSMVPHVDDDRLHAATLALLDDPPDVVVVTTGIGFRSWIEAADAHGIADPLLAVLAGARIVARGPKARGAIQAAGLAADWVAESESSAEIADLLLGEGVAGLRIAIQHHGAGADGLDVVLAEAGAAV